MNSFCKSSFGVHQQVLVIMRRNLFWHLCMIRRFDGLMHLHSSIPYVQMDLKMTWKMSFFDLSFILEYRPISLYTSRILFFFRSFRWIFQVRLESRWSRSRYFADSFCCIWSPLIYERWWGCLLWNAKITWTVFWGWSLIFHCRAHSSTLFIASCRLFSAICFDGCVISKCGYFDSSCGWDIGST